jgi:dsDNA-binding SOS-regulon protein
MKYNKYLNKKTEIDGITFASKKEAKRYSELKLLEKAKKIEDLQLQKALNF